MGLLIYIYIYYIYICVWKKHLSIKIPWGCTKVSMVRWFWWGRTVVLPKVGTYALQLQRYEYFFRVDQRRKRTIWCSKHLKTAGYLHVLLKNEHKPLETIGFHWNNQWFPLKCYPWDDWKSIIPFSDCGVQQPSPERLRIKSSSWCSPWFC